MNSPKLALLSYTFKDMGGTALTGNVTVFISANKQAARLYADEKGSKLISAIGQMETNSSGVCTAYVDGTKIYALTLTHPVSNAILGVVPFVLPQDVGLLAPANMGPVGPTGPVGNDGPTGPTGPAA